MGPQVKTALVTGAARRIGREISQALAARGIFVLLHCNRSEKEARRLEKEIRAAGGCASIVRADFSPARKPLLPVIRDFVREVHRRVPRVDILVNNAAIFYPAPVGKITEKAWDEFLTVNLKAPFFLAHEFGIRMFKRKSGCIVNIADWSAFRPYSDYLPYAVSKAGLVAATAGLAKALAPHVRVNCVAPGPILPAAGATPRQNRKAAGRTLLKRFGSPRDVAAAVCFLCEEAPFTTGASIPVEGGALAV